MPSYKPTKTDTRSGKTDTKSTKSEAKRSESYEPELIHDAGESTRRDLIPVCCLVDWRDFDVQDWTVGCEDLSATAEVAISASDRIFRVKGMTVDIQVLMIMCEMLFYVLEPSCSLG